MSTSTAHAIEVTKEATPATKTAKHANAVDPTIPPYKKVNEAVSGSIKSIGSDTMNNLMAKWAEGFKKLYPNVTIEIEGKGTATAPPALIAGTANFGPMSRQMKGKEIDDFEKKFGYKPLALPTGLDMLAVYVHKDNPLKGLTLQQVDAIYSKTRKGGADRAITTWGELGLTGEWKDKPISLYGRNAASGTYGYFKDYALFGGDYKNSVKEQPGSSAVVQGVASDKYAMGYSGIGYKTADVIALPLAAKAGVEFAAPEAQNAYNGKYPLSRFLYVYINQRPGKPLDALRREFIKYIMSQDGQRDVVNGDYLPIPYKVTQRALESVLVVPPAPLKTGGR
ncbi:MAG: PstS family phosphate ABC transporter substrate-binding protein [Planctomycetota bacterium]|nr:PstS family phosphate ABC transporter substrate-binding protein [Planctomycetota bacterium]